MTGPILPAATGDSSATEQSEREKKCIAAVRNWLQRVVVGLNLCPFAATPLRHGRVHYQVAKATDEEALLAELQAELQALSELDAEERETTLLIIPGLLADFYDYNQFLDRVDQLLVRDGWEGVFQVASFHPHYQFAGTAAEDPDNLTNRSPYPLLHLLREEQLTAVLDRHPQADQIPDNNIRTMQKLTDAQKRELFPYLFE